MRIKKAILSLLRSGLWDHEEIPDDLFPLSLDEWMTLYEMSAKQTVSGIVYDGVIQLPRSYQPPKSLLIKWTVFIDHLERMNKHHNQTLNLLSQILNQAPAIPFQLLKGQSLAQYYPNPLHRTCGDIDLYFGSAEVAEAANIRLEKLGIHIQRGHTGDSSYLFNGVIIEHHIRLIELHNPLLKDKILHFEKTQFNNPHPDHVLIMEDQLIRTPSPIAMHLLLSSHILKHMLNEGVGLRQLCDTAIALQSLASSTNNQHYKNTGKSFGLYHWNQLLYSVLTNYIGLSSDYLPFPVHPNPDFFLNEIWESGNFGHQDQRYLDRGTNHWEGKQVTAKRISHKMKLFAKYSPGESFWWMFDLSTVRLKELFIKQNQSL